MLLRETGVQRQPRKGTGDFARVPAGSLRGPGPSVNTLERLRGVTRADTASGWKLPTGQASERRAPEPPSPGPAQPLL